MTDICTEEQLDSLYDRPVPASNLKEVDHITDDYARLIAASPFVILATVGPEGLDCSPRGDPRGFARMADPKTLMIPDRRGNNPKCVVIITVECAYTQCQKAIARSRLWDVETHVDKTSLPTVGEMMERLAPGNFDGKAYDAEYPERMKRTIY